MRERSSQQINRAYYARGRPQNRLPRTINEGTDEVNFMEEDVGGDINRQNHLTQQHLQPTLQRRFYSEADVRTERQDGFHVDYTAVEIDFDNNTDDHVNALTSGLGSTWTIADP